MKKQILVILTILIVAAAAGAQTTADSRRQRQLQKECQAKLKSIERAGWEIAGGDAAMQKHYDKLAADADAIEIYGTAGRAKDTASGMNQATQNACATYAEQQSQDLKGRVVNELAPGSGAISADMEAFFKAYENGVKNEIKSKMQPSYRLERKNADGSIDIEAYFIISESDASGARARALQSALPTSASAQKNSARLLEFVKSGF